MKTIILNLTGATIFMLIFTDSIFSQSTIYGNIKIGEDGISLEGVNLVIKGTTEGVTTDMSGNYSIAVPTGEVTLKVNANGYSGTERTFFASAGSNEMNFWIDAVSDIDGNHYSAVEIGTQVWMGENLKTTRYNDGITNIDYPYTDNNAWVNNTTGGYSWYNNDVDNFKGLYGALYNWYAVRRGNLCPTGWHVPSGHDWENLETYLGGKEVAGGKLKETGTLHWYEPNTGATNESGFSALPGGWRKDDGTFFHLPMAAYFWSSSPYESIPGTGEGRRIIYGGTQIQVRTEEKYTGCSVRCVKDADPTIVTVTNDAGEGSLRNAIEYANSTPGVKETITFNIPGTGPFTIQPLTLLPEISDPVVIDGFTQPSASASDLTMMIELSGTNITTDAIGLKIFSDNCIIRGLVINRFNTGQIYISSGLSQVNPQQGINNTISGNFIGTDITGKNIYPDNMVGIGIMLSGNNNKIGGNTSSERNIISGNVHGIMISGKGHSVIGNYIGADISGKLKLMNYGTGILINWGSDNTVGGAGQGERNIISGNNQTGIIIQNRTSTGNKIIGNYIGVDVSGGSPLGNGDCGIRISNEASDNVIGGSHPGEGNVISDNSGDGILIKFTSTDDVPKATPRNKIQGNYIGTDAFGTGSHGNEENGIRLDEYAINNLIGGNESGEGNIVAFNGNSGILCSGVINPSSGNSILSNSIHSNVGLGINLGSDGVTHNDPGDSDVGPNNLQNFPVFDSVKYDPGNKSVYVGGYLQSEVNSQYTLQFFTNKTGDNNGHGEGMNYLGSAKVTTGGDGRGLFGETFAVSGSWGDIISATATDERGNTSEYSENVEGDLNMTADDVKPVITGTFPADNADNVFVKENVTIFFSESMSRNSVENCFALTWADGVPAVIKEVDGSFSWDNESKSLTFIPRNNMKEGTLFTVTVSAEATDLSGNTFKSGNSFKFTTVPKAAPEIVYLGPLDQEKNVTVTTPIVADFSEPIDTSNVNSTTFGLSLNGVSVPGKFEFLNGNSRVVFRPNAHLGFGKLYTIKITSGIKDVSDPVLKMKTGKASSFMTATRQTVPHISYLEPPAGAIGSEVVIAGKGFDPNPHNNIVKFNNIRASVISSTLTELITKVPLGTLPGNVTVTGKNGIHADNSAYFYVIPQSDDLCQSVVSGSSVGSKSTKDIALDPNGAFAYVTNPQSDEVTVIDLIRSASIKSIPVGKTPVKIDINPSGSLAYVANFNSNDVSVIDLGTKSVIKTIKVGIEPYGIKVTPNGKGVYVANYFSENLSLIDVDPNSGGSDHVVANVSTGSMPGNLVATPDGSMVLVTGDYGLKIVSANPKDPDYNCVVATACSGIKIREVACTPDAAFAIVSTEEGNLLVINLHPENGDYSDAVIDNVPAGTNISNIKVSGDAMFVYVTATDNDEILVYKINRGGHGTSNKKYVSGISLVPHSTIPVGNAPEGLVIDSRARKIVVIDGPLRSRRVTVIKLCCGPVNPEKAIDDLIMSVQSMVRSGYITEVNGKDLIDKLNGALLDLLKGRTDKAINDLNVFINKVQAQIYWHKITAAQVKPLINTTKVIITQLSETNSSISEFSLADNEESNMGLISISKLGVFFPNPFSESITFNYEIAEDRENFNKVLLRIYDIHGRLVSTLVDNTMQPGQYTVTWNGKYENGTPAAYGTYFVIFRNGNVEEVKEIMLIR